MNGAFSSFDVLICLLWVVGIAVGLTVRFLTVRRRLKRRATRELAEQIGLVFDECCPHGGVGAFGQLPDGRGVRLYEELKHRAHMLFPWQRSLRVASVLEVGVEGLAWEQLDVDQRDEARSRMSGHFYRALDRHREELTRLGFPRVALSGQTVRLRTPKRLPAADKMATVVEVLGKIAAETEAACVAQVLGGPEPAGERKAEQKPEPCDHSAETTVPADLPGPTERAVGEPAAGRPWRCATCQALNPASLNRCQMCSAERTALPQPASR